jgi:hypothetical protein
VRKRVGEKVIIPVWTTECEEVDLPADKNHGRPGTGRCGTVGCATGACPEAFTRQWTALTSSHTGSMALLALHTALERTEPEFGGGPQWVTNVIAYLNRTLPANGGTAMPLIGSGVVQGLQPGRHRPKPRREFGWRRLSCRALVDQSYEPRMVSTR